MFADYRSRQQNENFEKFYVMELISLTVARTARE